MNTENESPAQTAQSNLAALATLLQELTVAAASVPGLPEAFARRLSEATNLAAAICPIIKEAAEEERRCEAADEEVFGEGEHEYLVMVTLQTTATRTMRVHADNKEEAEEEAFSAAQELQGAFFVQNEGNYVSSDDISVNCVMDTQENEFAPDEDYMSIADQIAAQTGTDADDWTATEGPSSRVGTDYWYVNEKTGETAYVNMDQGEFSCSITSTGDDDDESHASPSI